MPGLMSSKYESRLNLVFRTEQSSGLIFQNHSSIESLIEDTFIRLESIHKLKKMLESHRLSGVELALTKHSLERLTPGDYVTARFEEQGNSQQNLTMRCEGIITSIWESIKRMVKWIGEKLGFGSSGGNNSDGGSNAPPKETAEKTNERLDEKKKEENKLAKLEKEKEEEEEKRKKLEKENKEKKEKEEEEKERLRQEAENQKKDEKKRKRHEEYIKQIEKDAEERAARLKKMEEESIVRTKKIEDEKRKREEEEKARPKFSSVTGEWIATIKPGSPFQDYFIDPVQVNYIEQVNNLKHNLKERVAFFQDYCSGISSFSVYKDYQEYAAKIINQHKNKEFVGSISPSNPKNNSEIFYAYMRYSFGTIYYIETEEDEHCIRLGQVENNYKLDKDHSVELSVEELKKITNAVADYYVEVKKARSDLERQWGIIEGLSLRDPRAKNSEVDFGKIIKEALKLCNNIILPLVNCRIWEIYTEVDKDCTVRKNG